MASSTIEDETHFPKELIEEQEEDKKGEHREDNKSESLYAQIMKMTVSEKIKLATVGNREARNILIKDSNKMIIMAVVNSPKLTEDDALAYASNRSLADEVINR